MDCKEIIIKLQSMASEKYKSNVVNMGIPESHSIGVSTGDVRELAKSIGKSNELAFELWETGFHEARLLAVLLFDKKLISLNEVERLMPDVISWDLCDHLCKNLIIKMKGFEDLILKWCEAEQTYTKRAAFTLIASAVIHQKNLSNDALNDYLKLIAKNSYDEREHVKKAVSWALKEIGKKDFEYQEKAILLAHDLKQNGTKAQIWIAKDALKELEKLVQVEGRGRLISFDSQMGKNI